MSSETKMTLLLWALTTRLIYNAMTHPPYIALLKYSSASFLGPVGTFQIKKSFTEIKIG